MEIEDLADKYSRICIEHRIQYGLSIKNICTYDCKAECKAEDTCPLNPKYEDDY